jgi:hypothetical protein
MARENIQRIIDGLMLLAEGETSKGCKTLAECPASDLREAAIAISVLVKMNVLDTPLAGAEEDAAQVERTSVKQADRPSAKYPRAQRLKR